LEFWLSFQPSDFEPKIITINPSLNFQIAHCSTDFTLAISHNVWAYSLNENISIQFKYRCKSSYRYKYSYRDRQINVDRQINLLLVLFFLEKPNSVLSRKFTLRVRRQWILWRKWKQISIFSVLSQLINFVIQWTYSYLPSYIIQIAGIQFNPQGIYNL
jgi:hypothetical protein